MKFLLDTHVLIWWFESNPELRPEASELIRCGENEVMVSSVSIWEIAIKSAIGKLSVPGNLRDLISKERFTPLPITHEHAFAIQRLPDHHSDPFDRMLIAQCRVEGLPVLTRDPKFRTYRVNVMDA